MAIGKSCHAVAGTSCSIVVCYLSYLMEGDDKFHLKVNEGKDVIFVPVKVTDLLISKH